MLMIHKNNNWLHYLLVFALVLLPLQNGMAAASSIASTPAQVKQVCHEMMGNGSDHGHHQSQAGNKMEMQQGHANGCCDKDMNCQQTCSDCAHAPAVSIIPHDVYKFHEQRVQDLYPAIKRFPDNTLTSLQFRPPRA